MSGAGKNDISGMEPVKPADSQVIKIGKFAVKEHLAGLLFIAVIGGFKWSVVGGSNYALIIETQDDYGATYLHKAHVFEVENEPGTLKLIWYKN